MATITMNGGDIEGETHVRGEVVINGETTLGARGNLEVTQLTITSGSEFKITDGSTFGPGAIELAAGAKIVFLNGSGNKTIGFNTLDAFLIDFGRGTVTSMDGNKYFTFTGGLNGALMAANDSGSANRLGDWY